MLKTLGTSLIHESIGLIHKFTGGAYTLDKKRKINLDDSTHKDFFDYYADKSISIESFQRFRNIRDTILRLRQKKDGEQTFLEVADIGCGAGTHCLIWSETGHKTHGLDINRALVELARERSKKSGYEVDYRIGTATELPWPDESIDVCIMLELLEHVVDWKTCLRECKRVLRDGGVLFLTTTNWLCPVQNEFRLPFYSWYPSPLKRNFERMAVSSRPELVNFAKYPAVNWFSFYSLQRELNANNFECNDRFDLIETSKKRPWLRLVIMIIKKINFLRFFGHVMSTGTTVAAIKKK